MTKQTYEDGETVTYQYDNNGALATVTDSETGIKTTYYYDFTDRLMKYVESGDGYSHAVGYEYDEINNLTALVETINGVDYTTSYTYDEDNRVSSVTNGDVSLAYTYDAYGRLQETNTTNDGNMVQRDSYTYLNPTETTTTGQVEYHRIQTSDSDNTYYYLYDDNGNITEILSALFNASLSTRYSYVYDSANQLIRENNAVAGKTWTWEYDDAGNILNRKEYAYTTGTLGTGLDTVTYTYGDSAWGDLLTSYDGNTITYDTIGNPLTDGTWTYTWQHGRQLASMTDGTTTWSYTYNSDGLRTKRTNGTDTYEYIYNGDKLSQVIAGTDVLYFAYDASGTPMAVTYNGVTYYYVTNLQGDVIAITDNAGYTVATYDYDAWGNAIITEDTVTSTIGNLNPLRYRGYVWDSDTQFYYLQSRYYDPELGRFINLDAFVSTGQGLLGNNMFAYCGNNPICRCDDTGTYYTPGQIHNFVVDDICKENPNKTSDDSYIIYYEPVFRGKKWYTYGFCDVYDTVTHEVWEVKRLGGGPTCSPVAAATQLGNYVARGFLKHHDSWKLKLGGTDTFIKPNVFTKTDNDGEGTYVIGYFDAGNGLVFYDYYYIPSAGETIAGACAVIGIYALVSGVGLAGLGAVPAMVRS